MTKLSTDALVRLIADHKQARAVRRGGGINTLEYRARWSNRALARKYGIASPQYIPVLIYGRSDNPGLRTAQERIDGVPIARHGQNQYTKRLQREE